MSSAIAQVRDSSIRRVARAVLVAAVRGRRERGGDWGEAVIAEFAETSGDVEAVRWALGGLRAAWQERRRRVRELPLRVRITRRVLAAVAVMVVGGLAVNQWVLTTYYMPSGSMEQAILIGDRLLVDKIVFHVMGLHRGDVVEINGPSSVQVKRVIGLPGDTISCGGGRVVLNGRMLEESYLKPFYPDEIFTECATVTVPAHHLYLLGDHRIVSQDSRQVGPVSENAVKGRVLVKVWPSFGGVG